MPDRHVQIDEKLTAHLAKLAQIELTSEETKTFSDQVGKILAYAEQLQEVDVEGIEPLNHPFDLATPLREDKVHPFPSNSAGKSKILDSAPEMLYDGFKVPPIMGG